MPHQKAEPKDNMMLDQEAMNGSKERLAILRRRLSICLRQRANYGPDVPPRVEIEIEDTRTEIREIKETLRANGMLVEDHPDDERHRALSLPSAPWNQLDRQSRIMWAVGVLALLLISIFIIQSFFKPDPPPSSRPTLAVSTPGQATGEIAPTAPWASPATIQPAAVPTTAGLTSPPGPPTSTNDYICDRQVQPDDGFGEGAVVANMDTSDNLYVVDQDKKRVLKLPALGTVFQDLILTSDTNTQIGKPSGVAIDKDGNVYVTWTNNQVRKFDSNGQPIKLWGSEGDKNGEFRNPTGIAVDREHGYVYVADTKNNRVQQFDLDGIYKHQWGSVGDGDGQFNEPHGIAVDNVRGYVYVADTNNHRIQQFDLRGNYKHQWGSVGDGDGQFNEPLGIAIDNVGNVYVADKGNNRFQKFTSDGVWLSTWGGFGHGDGQFATPRTISVDSTGNVYVADSANKRIQICRPI